MKNLFITGLLFLILASCSRQSIPVVTHKDSTSNQVTTYIAHDTVIRIKADSSSIKALIECQGKVPKLMEIIAYKAGKTVYVPKITLKHDTLIVDCVTDSAAIAFRYYSQHTSLFVKTNEMDVKEVAKPLPWYVKMFMYAGIAACSLGLLFVIYLIVKVYAKINLPFLK